MKKYVLPLLIILLANVSHAHDHGKNWKLRAHKLYPSPTEQPLVNATIHVRRDRISAISRGAARHGKGKSREQFAQPESARAAVKHVQSNLGAGADLTKLFVATPQQDGSVKYMPDRECTPSCPENKGFNRFQVCPVRSTLLRGLRAGGCVCN